MRATDTRFFFRPVAGELVTRLRGLGPLDWDRPTIAGSWSVRDVLAHLVDLTFRRLSFHRDAIAPPPPARPIASERDFVDFINGLNRDWVSVTRRFSPQVLTDLFEKASTDLADFFERLPMDAPALFAVSWAGEQTSEGWFDVGREFTELWHHQEQIRLAVGAPALADPRYLNAVLAIALRGLPHAYREVDASEGDAVVLRISGPAGGTWTLQRERGAWSMHEGEVDAPAARVRLSDQTAWRLLFNALPEGEAASRVTAEGQSRLTAPLLRARSIVV